MLSLKLVLKLLLIASSDFCDPIQCEDNVCLIIYL